LAEADALPLLSLVVLSVVLCLVLPPLEVQSLELPPLELLPLEVQSLELLPLELQPSEAEAEASVVLSLEVEAEALMSTRRVVNSPSLAPCPVKGRSAGVAANLLGIQSTQGLLYPEEAQALRTVPAFAHTARESL
jgi:hypothetical protein